LAERRWFWDLGPGAAAGQIKFVSPVDKLVAGLDRRRGAVDLDRWVTDGTTFARLDDTGEPLLETSIHLTRDGCED
jgi:hypothetical protein